MPPSELTPTVQVDPRPPATRDHRRSGRAPWWVTVLDVAAVLLVAAALSVAIFGGFRARVLGVMISAHSSVRLLIITAVLVAVRHYFHRVPSLMAQIFRTSTRFWAAESVRVIAPAFLWNRAAVLLTAYLAVVTVGYPTEVRFHVSGNEFANLPARWDAGWYLGIAQQGYRYDSRIKGQQNVAFFPAFPMAMRTTAVFFGGHVNDVRARPGNAMRILWSGVAVSLLAFAAALGYLFRMVRAFAGREAASASIQFALAYPVAFFFSAPYTEAMFVLTAVAAFYHFGRGQLGAAAVWGALAGLTRPNGFILSVPLLAMAVARAGVLPRLGSIIDQLNRFPDARPRMLADIAVAMTPVAGMLAFSAFVYSNWGDPFLWSKLHAAWGRTYQGLEPALGPVEALQEFGLYGYTSIAGMEVLHVLFFLVAVGLSVPIAFRLGLAYTAFILLTVVPPLLLGGWLSMARVTVVLFPIYAYLGVAVPAAHRIPLVMAFALLQGLGTILFFTWRQFY